MVQAQIKQFQATVIGRVQGVGFRYWVRNQAVSLGLYGWVRNLQTGNVQVLAQGDPAALGKLIDALYQGPSRAWVERVNVEWQTVDTSLTGFEIKTTSYY